MEPQHCGHKSVRHQGFTISGYKVRKVPWSSALSAQSAPHVHAWRRSKKTIVFKVLFLVGARLTGYFCQREGSGLGRGRREGAALKGPDFLLCNLLHFSPFSVPPLQLHRQQLTSPSFSADSNGLVFRLCRIISKSVDFIKCFRLFLLFTHKVGGNSGA